MLHWVALFAFAAVAVPGLGPIMAIGPILGALGGASLGAVTGGLIGALTNMGVPEAKAHDYAEGVRRGEAIVTVRTDPAGAERALRIMNVWSTRYSGQSGRLAITPVSNHYLKKSCGVNTTGKAETPSVSQQCLEPRRHVRGAVATVALFEESPTHAIRTPAH